MAMVELDILLVRQWPLLGPRGLACTVGILRGWALVDPVWKSRWFVVGERVARRIDGVGLIRMVGLIRLGLGVVGLGLVVVIVRTRGR